MLKKTITIVFIYICYYGFSQQSVLSSGSSVASNQGSFSFSIGQILTSQNLSSSASSVRAAIGLLSGAFTTTSQDTEQTTLDVGVNIISIVVAGFRTNVGNEKMLSAVPNSDGTITFKLSNLNAIGDIIHWIAINP